MGRKLKIIEEPEWLRKVAQDSYLNVRDVAEIFGHTTSSFTRAVRDGNFPAADLMFKNNKASKGRSRQWKVSTIRAEILRRQNLISKT